MSNFDNGFAVGYVLGKKGGGGGGGPCPPPEIVVYPSIEFLGVVPPDESNTVPKTTITSSYTVTPI